MATNSTIIFYVSGHGFGHATRAAAVMAELAGLRPGLKIFVRTQAPAYIFSGEGWKASWSLLPHDPVLVQRGPHEVDLEATYARHKAICSRWDEFVQGEAALIAKHGPKVVVSDVSPLGIAAAHKAGVSSVAVANFSWDWVLKHYSRKDSRWKPIVELYREAYSQARLVFRTPLHVPMSSFKRIIDAPLISRRAVMPAALVRRKLGLAPQVSRLVLVTLRGSDNGSLIGIPSRSFSPPPLAGGRSQRSRHLGRLRRCSEGEGGGSFAFISPMKRPPGFQGFWKTIPRNSPIPFVDLVAASDAVLSKPGYGIVSECWAHRIPLLYVPGEGNPEIPILVRWLRRLGGSHLMPRPDFLAGRWAEHLEAVFSLKKPWPGVPSDGAHFIARNIIKNFF